MAYRSVTFNSVVDGVFALAGVTRTTAADPTALLAQVIEFVNTRVREGIEYDFWPELCPVEERTYRDAWASATTYAAGAEVWFPNDDPDLAGYYAAKGAPDAPAAGQSPETHPAKWTRLVAFARYIALEQTGRTPIGEVVSLHRQDLRRNPHAPRLPFTVSADGIVPPQDAPNVVFLKFRIRPPVYSAANYADATPANFPVPYVIENFVRRAACADFLRMDAKFEEAGRMEARAREDLLNASDAAGASQGQYHTARAHTY